MNAALPAKADFFFFGPVAIRGIARQKNHMGTQQDQIMTKQTKKKTVVKQLAGGLRPETWFIENISIILFVNISISQKIPSARSDWPIRPDASQGVTEA